MRLTSVLCCVGQLPDGVDRHGRRGRHPSPGMRPGVPPAARHRIRRQRATRGARRSGSSRHHLHALLVDQRCRHRIQAVHETLPGTLIVTSGLRLRQSFAQVALMSVKDV